MGNKRALIITYYEAPNYGAFLQAYATQEFLITNGIDARILRHKANKPNFFTRVMDNHLSTKVIEYRNQIQHEIDKVQNHLRMANYGEQFDIAIIGSDEVWNVKNLTARHLTIFFRPYKNSSKTIAYSVCAGSTQPKHMKLFPYTVGIKRLSSVAVRDEYTEKLANKMGITNVKRTIDPTFLYDYKQSVLNRLVPENYLLVYTYGFSEESIKAVQMFASNHDLKIVATGSNCEWGDINPMVSPFEWLSLFKYSTYVVTSTFHGSVFSIIFEKQFAVIENDSNKVKSLLEEFHLLHRKVNPSNNLTDVFKDHIDYNYTNIFVDERRKQSSDYLLSHF